MPASLNVFGAGLKDISIRIADGSSYDMFGAVSINTDVQSQEVEVKGDDVVLGSFNFSLKQELKIVVNAISFDALQAILGNSVSSSAGGSEIALGTESEKNLPFVEVTSQTAAKDANNNLATIKAIWHKVQIKLDSIQKAGEQEFKIEMTGIAIPTSTGITGSALSTQRIATLKHVY